VTAFSGKVDCGQDNRTALTQLVAEELRVAVDQVALVMGDTDISPFDYILYGELLAGLRQIEVISTSAPVTPPDQWLVAGQPTPKVTAPSAVTGAKRYPSDLVRPGMLHGKVLTPPSFGATLRALDLSGARAVSGVTVIEEDGLVGVVAPDPVAVRTAMAAIRASWDEGRQPSESELVDYLRTHPEKVEGWGGSFHHEVGEVDRAFMAAPVQLTQTYTLAYIAHVPLETHVALVEWQGDELTVWTGTQTPFNVRRQLAQALEMPEDRIHVLVPDFGGGFGGKHTGELAISTARLARACGAPVRIQWSREEEFRQGHLRPAAVIDVRSGTSAQGELMAWEFTNINSGPQAILPVYRIPSQRIRFEPARSPLRQGSYRALAATANHFARESHIDEIANQLGMDPLELRLRNLGDERLATVFRAVAERAGWDWHAGHRGTALGIAGGLEKGGRIATSAEVRVDPDGRLELVRIVTGFECGAIVNPDNLVSQIEGATVMGLGGALFEAIHFEAGRIINPSMSRYRVPHLADVPPIEVILIDRKDVLPAGGGETPILAIAPAIANAIFAATGIRLRSMPLAPDGVIR
jgi:isoquinoline 1-oxidoreductase